MDVEFLKHVPIFRALGASDLQKIARIVVERSYRRGQAIFFERDSGDRLFIVRSGLIKIQQVADDGRVKTLDILDEGECFGEMALLRDEERSASAIALADSVLILAAKEDFLPLLRSNPDLALGIMRMLCDRVLNANRQIEDLVFRNLPGRIVSQLQELARKYGREVPEGVRIELEITHQAFAEMVGTNRESISKMFSQFRKEGSILTRDRHVILVDQDKLSAWA